MRTAGLLSLTLILTGCGYVGDPLPPALKIPNPVADLQVAQRGAFLELSYTLPTQTMEGLEVEKLGRVELRISETWPDGGRTIEVAPGETKPKIEVKDWAGKEVAIGVRVANAKLRFSPWSNLVRLRVEPEVAKPSRVIAEATANGVLLRWEAPEQPGVEWKVYRLGALNNVVDKDPVEVACVKTKSFLDTGAEFGGRYRYTLEGILRDAISESSVAVEIEPVDKFPPAAPEGLAALAGATAIQLSWERNTEQDVVHYRVYRAISSGPWAVLEARQLSATFADQKIQSGQRLRYSVTAVDRNGNESPKSKEVEITVP